MQDDFVLGIVLLSMVLLALGVIGCLADSEDKRKGDQALEAKRQARAKRARYQTLGYHVREVQKERGKLVNRQYEARWRD